MSYSDDDDYYNMESGGEDSDGGRDSDDALAMDEDPTQSEVSYVVLKEEDIRKRQSDDIERVSSILSVSQVDSIVLLLHYHWSVDRVQDLWFTDEEKVRKLVGLFKEPLVDYGRDVEIECGICFDSYGREEIVSVSCGHPYCLTCWTGFIQSKIGDGLGCLMFKCPEPSCSAAVGQDMILEFLKGEDVERYYRYLLMSYVEDGGKIKWCPSPGCEYAVDIGNRSENYDVSCLCSNNFCWKCSEETHRPVDCETVSKWILKNSDESENTNWILVNTKPCPKCKRQIEKNQGCMHMTCSKPCGFEFCWTCLAPYNTHGTCNSYNPTDENDIRRQMAKHALNRYTHYFERWSENQKSEKLAMKDLEKLQTVQLKELSRRQNKPETELQFTVEAWLQIIECRRMIKWTYAYGYYLPENQQAKRKFFEYLQGEADGALDKLHHCAEKELKQFIISTKESEVPINAFDDFRRKLVGLTKLNKTYFGNLVKAWENGLEDDGFIENNSTSSSFKRKKNRVEEYYYSTTDYN